MLVDLTLVTVGLAVLLTGAWLTVRSAAGLAASFGLSRVLIGATVVAFGTSAPEFVVSLAAVTRDAAGLAVGNVLGSNVANVGLVLGAAALMRPISVHWRLLRWEVPVLGAATALVLLFAADGRINRAEGAGMFLLLIAFVVISMRLWPEAAEALEAEGEDAAAAVPDWRWRALQGGLLLVGLAGLTAGAEMAVRGAIGLAERANLSETAIGATIVATGTSLPEVATSVTAVIRREHDIAVANVVGSNIFNLLGVLGLTAVVGTLAVDQGLYSFEMPALLVSTVVLVPLMWFGRHISRAEGAGLLALYVAFVTVVLVRA